MTTKSNEKPAYEAPALEELGQLGAVTQAKRFGLGDAILWRGTTGPPTHGSA